jgi:hypothetical protein
MYGGGMEDVCRRHTGDIQKGTQIIMIFMIHPDKS